MMMCGVAMKGSWVLLYEIIHQHIKGGDEEPMMVRSSAYGMMNALRDFEFLYYIEHISSVVVLCDEHIFKIYLILFIFGVEL